MPDLGQYDLLPPVQAAQERMYARDAGPLPVGGVEPREDGRGTWEILEARAERLNPVERGREAA